MIRNWLRVMAAIGALALGCAPAWAQPRQPAPQMQRQQPQLQQQVAPGQCTSPDRVAVTGFSVNPPQPRQGQTVTVTLTIQNVCNGPLASVPWTIEVGTGTGANQVLGSGVQQNVLAGASFSVTANWTAVPGQRGFLGTADRENVLRESVQNRQNNYKDFPVNVPQMSADTAAPPGTAPPLTTLLLDFEKAKEAGAQFSHNVESGGPCPEIGVFDVNSSASGGIGLDDSRKPASGVLFSIVCQFIAPSPVLFSIVCQFIAPSPVGARAPPEAFTNFRLKNGWKVKDYDIVDQKKFNGDWQWRQTPQKGTADPSMRMHLWVNPGGNAIAVVRIVIEGPVGTDPYK